MSAIAVENLVKQYKNGVKALNGLNITVNNGEIFSLLGQNGAGKSSLINILTTFYKPTSGKVTILDKDLYSSAHSIRSQIACVAQNISIDTHLSLIENMKFQSRLYNVEPQVAKKRMKSLINTFQLERYVDYPTASYSGGVKRRLDIAMNLISSPKILFLDEPTVGMDVAARNMMWNMLLKTREEYGTTIFLTTHYLEEADELSDSICIMKEGKELVQGSPQELRSYIRQDIIKISFRDKETAKSVKDLLNKENMTKHITIKQNSLYAYVEDCKRDFILLNQWLLQHNIEFEAIGIVEPSLEDVFLAVTDNK